LVIEQNTESVLLKALLERFDTARVEPLCGKTRSRQRRPLLPALIPEPPLQPPVNTNLTLHYVEDTAADQDISGCFQPAEDILDFDGQDRCQQDIAV